MEEGIDTYGPSEAGYRVCRTTYFGLDQINIPNSKLVFSLAGKKETNGVLCRNDNDARELYDHYGCCYEHLPEVISVKVDWKSVLVKYDFTTTNQTDILDALDICESDPSGISHNGSETVQYKKTVFINNQTAGPPGVISEGVAENNTVLYLPFSWTLQDRANSSLFTWQSLSYNLNNDAAANVAYINTKLTVDPYNGEQWSTVCDKYSSDISKKIACLFSIQDGWRSSFVYSRSASSYRYIGAFFDDKCQEGFSTVFPGMDPSKDNWLSNPLRNRFGNCNALDPYGSSFPAADGSLTRLGEMSQIKDTQIRVLEDSGLATAPTQFIYTISDIPNQYYPISLFYFDRGSFYNQFTGNVNIIGLDVFNGSYFINSEQSGCPDNSYVETAPVTIRPIQITGSPPLCTVADQTPEYGEFEGEAVLYVPALISATFDAGGPASGWIYVFWKDPRNIFAPNGSTAAVLGPSYIAGNCEEYDRSLSHNFLPNCWDLQMPNPYFRVRLDITYQ